MTPSSATQYLWSIVDVSGLSSKIEHQILGKKNFLRLFFPINPPVDISISIDSSTSQTIRLASPFKHSLNPLFSYHTVVEIEGRNSTKTDIKDKEEQNQALQRASGFPLVGVCLTTSAGGFNRAQSRGVEDKKELKRAKQNMEKLGKVEIQSRSGPDSLVLLKDLKDLKDIRVHLMVRHGQLLTQV